MFKYLVIISANIDPLYGFAMWSSDSVFLMPNTTSLIDSFYVTHYDTIRLHIYELPTINAFISGNDSLCFNDNKEAEIEVKFSPECQPPYKFVYAINGEIQDTVFTSQDPYIIYTSKEGFYTLNYFEDSDNIGWTDGEGIVTVFPGPTANFTAHPDTMNILYTTTQMHDRSTGGISSWSWYFGGDPNDPFNESELQNPTYTYSDSAGSSAVPWS